MNHALPYLHRVLLGPALVVVLAAASTTLRAQSVSDVPAVAATYGVSATTGLWQGRRALAVELTDEEQARVLAGGGGNGATYALIDADFTDGVIEVDIGGELTGKGAPDARAFVGIAFHIPEDRKTYEAVYLRMANGTLNVPPPPAPRNVRAVQYVAHPDFHFNISREKSPGQYEKAAPVALARWHHLRLEIEGSRIRVLVDGGEVLVVRDIKFAGRRGRIGLWVDDGTRGQFANLRVESKVNGSSMGRVTERTHAEADLILPSGCFHRFQRRLPAEADVGKGSRAEIKAHRAKDRNLPGAVVRIKPSLIGGGSRGEAVTRMFGTARETGRLCVACPIARGIRPQLSRLA
ncbi:MAG: hypothetical protein U1F10_10350 [Burkholderiales bacterium]